MNLLGLLNRELNKTTFSMSESDVLFFSKNAPKKYKVYSIPKRNAGTRIIAHPSKELKRYQRILVNLFQDILPTHNAAFAYRKGLSIRENAECHKKSKYLLKMDFENFFNSINPLILKNELVKNKILYTAQDFELLQQLCFWCPSKKIGGKLILSVGAPTSPSISNFIMNQFDELVASWCKQRKITYTRYADDISFSTNIKTALFEVPKFIELTLKANFGKKISIKASKTVFSSKAHNRHITGVTITNEGELSIGRERKRYVSSLIHKFKLNMLAQEEIEHLKGLLGFAFHIEPVFRERMTNKYSMKTMDEINQFRSEN
jgi:retron-type reverse transcriptase